MEEKITLEEPIKNKSKEKKMREKDSTVLHIVVPKVMEEFVKKKVESFGYRSVSEYIRELIRKNMEDIK